MFIEVTITAIDGTRCDAERAQWINVDRIDGFASYPKDPQLTEVIYNDCTLLIKGHADWLAAQLNGDA